jgi:hypothetical protein
MIAHATIRPSETQRQRFLLHSRSRRPVEHGHVARVVDWPHSSFHRDVERGLLAADWGGDMKEIQGAFGE